MTKKNGPKANYGIDSPAVIISLGLFGIIILYIAFWLFDALYQNYPIISGFLLGFCLISAGCLLISSLLMIYSSKFGKIRVADEMIAPLKLQGHETVLDVGCGRGLLLIKTAKKLSEGKAVGIDLWQASDQSGNKLDSTLENAKREGTEERIKIVTGDMTGMPFSDDSFDVVLSSLAIHNIRNEEDRSKALSEILRVLKPGGRFKLLDFKYIYQYRDYFAKQGCAELVVSDWDGRMFPPVRTISGKKA